MTRTPTLPLDDRRMWRRILKLAHPDAGGGHEDFIWLQSVQDAVCNAPQTPRSRTEREHRTQHHPQASDDPARVPFPPGCVFDEITSLALERAGQVPCIHGGVLFLLEDCYPIDHLVHEEQRGASYKRLAYIAHLAGMSKAERVRWYRIAEGIPLSDRHAGHILSRLKRSAV